MLINSPLFIHGLSLRSHSPADQFPYTIPAIKDLNINFDRPVTFLAGENGSGKSTLLESLAEKCGFAAMGGSKQHHFAEEYEHPLTSNLVLNRNPRKRIDQGFFFRAESFFNLSKYIDENANLKFWGGKQLVHQSHGESFLAVFNHQFREGLFLLDEPEAALSPQRQLSFLTILHGMEKEGRSQLIIATHSPLLLAYPNARILWLNENGINEVAYEDTEHFQITKSFLDNPKLYFRMLFAD
jgi:predicted ATPase